MPVLNFGNTSDSLNYPTIKPTLDFNFVGNAVLDPRITFTRSSNTATFFNSLGVLTTASSNVPRFDFDPITLTPRGLLIEESRTNQLIRSQEYNNAAWARTGAGVAIAPVLTENAGIAPDGTTTASRVQFDCVNTGTSVNRSWITASPTYTSGTNYSASIWVRAFDASNVGRTIRFVIDSVGGGVFTLLSSWQRISFSGVSSVTGGSNFLIETRGTFTGQTADVLLWGAQLEVGSFVTSYIPTFGGSVTRAVDLPIAAISPWFQSSAGTWYLETVPLIPSGIATQLAVSAGGGYSVGNGMLIRYSGPNSIEFGGNAQAVSRSGAGLGAINKIAASYEGVNASLVVNGSTVGALTNLDFTGSGTTTLLLGALNTGGSQQGSLYVRRLCYYPRRLSDSELQILTL